MRRLSVSDVRGLKATLQEVALKTPECRHLHRLHQVLLIALGNSCYQVAKWFGEDPRTVERWVRRYESSGGAALRDGYRTGRPPRLTPLRSASLAGLLVARYPRSAWSGRLLKTQLEERLGIVLSLRHCQRLLRRIRPAHDAAADPVASIADC